MCVCERVSVCVCVCVVSSDHMSLSVCCISCYDTVVVVMLCLQVNSLEQLCVNWTAERLQHHFKQSLFTATISQCM